MDKGNRIASHLAAGLSLALAVGVALAWSATLGSALAWSAEEAAAPAAVTAPAAPAPIAEPATGKAASITMRIGEDGKDGEPAGRGIEISVSGDADEASHEAAVAQRVVDRVMGELEQALAGLPEEVRKDLDEEDLRELREALSEIRDLRDPQHVVVSDHDGEEDTWAAVAPGVVAIVLLFGGPVAIVAIVSRNNRRKREMVHQTIDRVIEQGRDVPVELLDALDKGKNSGKTTLSRGTVNVALGVGIFAALYNLSGFDVATLGLIPLCIGVAQLIVWVVEKRPADRTPAA